MDLLNDFRDYLNKNRLIMKKDSVLLGVSGGPDSLTMLDLFNRLKEELQLKMTIFHLNHKFREEAADEAEYVARVCDRYQLEAYIEEYDVPALIARESLSPEEAARQVRMKLMSELADRLDIKKIALAHNKDDHVETIFLHMFRGAGLKGLTGIRPVSRREGRDVIHPLLEFYRYQIEDYCQYRDLSPRRDPTNEQTIYTRNKIRHQLIPYLEKEVNPAIKELMVRMADNISKEDSFLNQLTDEAVNRVIIKEGDSNLVLSLPGLQRLSEVVRRRTLQQVLYRLKGNKADLYSAHFLALEQLILTGESGKRIDLPEDITVTKSYDSLLLQLGRISQVIDQYSYQLDLPGAVKLPGGGLISGEIISSPIDWRKQADNPAVCFLDGDVVRKPLVVRNRRPGDRFIPLGLKGKKKLKDFFIDEKVPRIERDLVPLVCDQQGKILWVAGHRMDDRIRITSQTKRVIKLIYQKEEE